MTGSGDFEPPLGGGGRQEIVKTLATGEWKKLNSFHFPVHSINTEIYSLRSLLGRHQCPDAGGRDAVFENHLQS